LTRRPWPDEDGQRPRTESPGFGGHSHPNEFHIGDTTLLRNGGTVNLDSIGTWNRPAGSLLDIPGSYGQPALDMLAFCGVDPANFPSTAGPGIPSSYGLRTMLLFPRSDFGQDYLVASKTGAQTWTEFLAATPYSPPGARGHRARVRRRDHRLISLKHGPKTDQEKKAILARITYMRYLMDYVGLNEQAASWFQRRSHGLFAAGIHVTQAGDMWALEEDGFAGLGSTATSSRASGAPRSRTSSRTAARGRCSR
jgi:hypothetical protein